MVWIPDLKKIHDACEAIKAFVRGENSTPVSRVSVLIFVLLVGGIIGYQIRSYVGFASTDSNLDTGRQENGQAPVTTESDEATIVHERPPDRHFPVAIPKVQYAEEITEANLINHSTFIQEHAVRLRARFGGATYDKRFLVYSDSLNYWKCFRWVLTARESAYSIHVYGAYLVRHLDSSAFYHPLLAPPVASEVEVPPISRTGDQVMLILSIESDMQSVPAESYIPAFLQTQIQACPERE